MNVYEVRDDANNWIDRAFFLRKVEANAKAKEWGVSSELTRVHVFRLSDNAATLRQDLLKMLKAVAHAHLVD